MRKHVFGVMALAMLLITGLIAPATAVMVTPGDDHGACEGLEWIKFDYDDSTDGWTSQRSKGLHEQVADPVLSNVIHKEGESGEPIGLDWTSSTPALSVHTKSGPNTPADTGTSGTSGTIHTGAAQAQPAISFVLFCFGPPEYDIALTKTWIVAENGDTQGLFDAENASATLTATPSSGLRLGDGFEVAETDIDTGSAACRVTETAGLGSFTVTESLLPEAGTTISLEVVNTVTCEAAAPELTAIVFTKAWTGDDFEGSEDVVVTFEIAIDGTVVPLAEGEVSPPFDADATWTLLGENVSGFPSDECTYAAAVGTGAMVDGVLTVMVTNEVTCGTVEVLPAQPIEREPEGLTPQPEVVTPEPEAATVEPETAVLGETVTRTTPTRIDSGTGGSLDNTGLLALLLLGGAALSGFGITSAATARRRR